MTKKIQLKQQCDVSTCIKSGIIPFIAQECIQCSVCMEECRFLQKNGLPGQIAENVLQNKDDFVSMAFSCSLCRLCTNLCPKELPIADMFLELRRTAVKSDEQILKNYKPIRFYEALGSSALLKRDFLPEGCDTVFFPGCALPGIRPQQTEQLFLCLRKKIPKLGLVLDCCSKPSHDLGDQDGFLKKNRKQVKRLRDAGVRHIITSCSSCLQIFRDYASGVEISMAYTHLLEQKKKSDSNKQVSGIVGQCTVHDPCTMRFEPELQECVRGLISVMGGDVVEMKHSGMQTFCCGEGGAVGFTEKDNKTAWQDRRKNEAGSLPIVTYCAGCTISLHSPTTLHILDLIFPDKDGKDNRLIKPPVTYVNRFLFRKKMTSYFASLV